MGNASLLRLAPDIQHHAGNLPDERAAPSTAVEAAEGTMTETTAANVPITNPAAANAAAAASAAATATAMDFPKLRKRTKRNLTEELECICGQEVTEQQRQSSALQCTRAGCETIWFLGSMPSVQTRAVGRDGYSCGKRRWTGAERAEKEWAKSKKDSRKTRRCAGACE
ncbi:hypothetical protein R3P38DRAFT_2798748 [Favolaschia claudopus]